MCFAVRRGEINKRLNADYYHPERRLAIAKICKQWTAKNRDALGHIVEFGEVIKQFNEELPYIGLANVESEFGNFVQTDEEAPEGTCRLYEAGQVLYGKLRPYLNKVHMPHNIGQCSTEFYCLTAKDRVQLSHEFLAAFLISKPFLSQTVHMMTGNTHPRIQREDFEEILIPLPPLDIQQAFVAELEAARATRKQKLAEADALLAGVDSFVLQQLGLTATQEEKRLAFAIRRKQIDEAINAERYANLRTEKLVKGREIGSMVEIVENKISPSNAAPDDFFDWIRIDDLPNHPLEVGDVRTELGKDIDGSLFEVQENDILLARLGPTILNAKFVLCPKTNRRTVASGEFLVLRCRSGWNPLAVLWVLRTKMFRDLMYSKARGGTPSRYRLNREDLAALTFPEMSPKAQATIMSEIERRLTDVKRLREQANTGWQAAKARFEQQLLGESEE